MDEDWALRYGRQIRLVSQPGHPAARVKSAGHDAADLLKRVRSRRPGTAATAGREGRLPPTGRRLESPYDLDARYTRRGHRTWVSCLAHATETCDEGSINVITDVATAVPTGDSVALPGIHTRL